MAPDKDDSGALLLTWDVHSDGEEPWRRLLQELSEAHWQEEHVAACRRLGISVESIWFVPKMGGGGAAVIYLEAEDPERTMRELVASETLFDSWGIGGMGRLFGFGFSLDSVQASRVAGGEILPNVIPPALAFSLVAVAVAIVAEGALAFLALSV